MMFSPLTARTVAHHNKYSSRFGAGVQRLILHHWAGTAGGDTRLTDSREDVSASYILYTNGDLVGQVPEEHRPWTSGSPEADNSSITVETQNSAGGPDWPTSQEALEKIAQLLADLSTRYGWGKITASRLRLHREFAATACPGPFLVRHRDWIINRANQIRTGGSPQKRGLFGMSKRLGPFDHKKKRSIPGDDQWRTVPIKTGRSYIVKGGTDVAGVAILDISGVTDDGRVQARVIPCGYNKGKRMPRSNALGIARIENVRGLQQVSIPFIGKIGQKIGKLPARVYIDIRHNQPTPISLDRVRIRGLES